MNRLPGILTLLFLSLVFSNCQREVSYVGGPDTNAGQIATPDPITGAIQGNVFDESGAPAAGVAVQVGNKTATTDSRGYFRINDAALDKKSALVTATKTGYYKAYRTFAATSGANNVSVKLVKKTLTGNIDGAAGGEVSLSNGSKVALPAAGVVNASTGAAYTGQVRVYASYIDPSAGDIDQTVPGSFMANDKDGKRVTLTSYGMVAVELEGASGEKLQIKSGATSTLTTAIPSASQASAPATIALWSVDETTGVWKEEGTATKNGNVYVGQVKHFSFWNCDVSANAILLSLKLQFPGAESFVNANVRIKRTANNWSVYGRTDSIGQVSGYVPYNEALVMDVLDQCGGAIYSQNIGPFTQNTSLGAINVSAPATATFAVKGKLVDCSNATVTNGYAFVHFGTETRLVSATATGDFQTTFVRCSGSAASVSITGVDKSAQQQNSTPVTIAVVAPVTDAGNVSACGTSITQFANYTVDGTNYSFSSSMPGVLFGGYTDSLQSGVLATTTIKAYLSTTNYDRLIFSFRHAGAVAGTYTLNGLMAQNYSTTGGLVRVTLASPSTVVITSFPQGPGQFYEGTINSSFTDSLNVNHTVAGTFKVLRQ